MCIRSKSGFSLVELMVVISIISLLASIILVSVGGSRNKSKAALAAENQKEMQKALELYYDDVGFYPPDVGRGYDPGFMKPLPYNKDTGIDCNTNLGNCPVCPITQCPSDWVAQVQAKWHGPYISNYNNTTPWGGKYDYNYWIVGTDRYIDQNTGVVCHITPGIYIGVQGDYSDGHMIPPDAEQMLLSKQLDDDKCLDGESQMILNSL